MNSKLFEILLVEDNPVDAELTIRELTKQTLANNLFHVKNGKEAVDFLFGVGKYVGVTNIQYPPKVILLDIQMPKMSGIEVLQIIKKDPRTLAIPVVMLTSSNESPDIRTCYQLGANSYIVKPVNDKGFTDVLRHLGIYWLLFNQHPV